MLAQNSKLPIAQLVRHKLPFFCGAVQIVLEFFDRLRAQGEGIIPSQLDQDDIGFRKSDHLRLSAIA